MLSRPAGRADVVAAQGWDFAVVVVGGDTVVRIPRRDDVVPSAGMEEVLLPDLRARLPVAVPDISGACPVHASQRYPLILGEPLTPAMAKRLDPHAVAAQAARFLLALHAFPVPEATRLGVPPDDLGEMLVDFAERVVPLLPDPARGQALLDDVTAARIGVAPALTHGDLGRHHLLCDAQGISGVIDWADANVGDPATDLAWLCNTDGGRLREPLVEAYGMDDAQLRRADLRHRLGPWWEVVHGLDRGQPALVRSGVAGIIDRLP